MHKREAYAPLAAGLSMLARLATAALFILPLAPLPAAAQDGEWQDPSVHAAALVAVEPGVQLEVLDWGGSGRPILLLAGLGDTAHVFDDFAPSLTDRHRVFALTRRGFGDSSAPETGYDFDRLAEDVISVIRTLGLKDTIIVGHSFAGEEMHIIGHRYASEIGGLVYIDAAFDRADRSRDYDRKLAELPASPQPQASDLRTIATYRDFAVRNGLPVAPEAAVRDRYEVDPAGTIGAPRRPAPHVQQSITAAMTALVQTYHPKPIRVPALAIYAVPEKPNDLMRPWYDQGDAAVQAKVEEAFALALERYRRHAEWFRTLAQNSPAIGLPGQHHLFISHPAEVQAGIEAFAATLDSGDRNSH